MEKKVKMTLVGVNGNSLAIMSLFQKNAKKQGWTDEEITEVLDEATNDDYDHLLGTILNNTEE